MTIARVTQYDAETLRTGQPKARATQSVAESLRVGQPKARTTQSVVETIRPAHVIWNVSAANTFSIDATAAGELEFGIVRASASNSFGLSTSSACQADYLVTSSNSFGFSVSVGGTSPIRVSASSSFALSSAVSASTVFVVDASSSLWISADSEQGTYRVSAGNSFAFSLTLVGGATRFASASNHINLTASIALGGGFTYSVSAFNTLAFKSIARTPMEYLVAANSSIIFVSTVDCYTSPIRVSAGNSFVLSAATSTKGPIYASASNSLKFSQDLTLRHLHAYHVSASNRFALSSVATSLNHAVHHVSAANNFSLGSSASGARDMVVSASNSFSISTTSSQTRDIYAGASTAFSLQALPGSNNFFEIDASSSAQFFTSSSAITTGELAESSFGLSNFAFASVVFPWRRTTLTLPPGGGLPHS